MFSDPWVTLGHILTTTFMSLYIDILIRCFKFVHTHNFLFYYIIVNVYLRYSVEFLIRYVDNLIKVQFLFSCFPTRARFNDEIFKLCGIS